MPVALIIGAYSDIALATAYALAKKGVNLQLAARDINRLQQTSSDLAIRYDITVDLIELDILDSDYFGDFINNLSPLPDIAICTVGMLGEQTADQKNLYEAVKIIRTNFEGPATILGELTNAFCERGSGTIVGISSVAGERGRAANYIYGSAKAGMTTYLSGLRNRCFKHNVHVTTILLGFVDTKMTAGLDLPKILTAKPKSVARVIVRSLERKSDVIYIKRIWAFIMWIVKHLPERIFKLLNF